MATGYSLCTTRLTMEPLTAADHEWFWWVNTHPHTRAHLWDGDTISEDQAGDVLAQNAAFFGTQGFGLWKAFHDATPVGYYGLWFFFDEPQPQILYVTDPEHTRRGYAAEAAHAVADYAFGALAFGYLDAAIDAANAASQRVARALGMRRLQAAEIHGRATLVFRLDRTAWRPARRASSTPEVSGGAASAQ